MVEREKPEFKKGTYMKPELYDAPAEKSYLRNKRYNRVSAIDNQSEKMNSLPLAE
jgi:hypothetical protein